MLRGGERGGRSVVGRLRVGNQGGCDASCEERANDVGKDEERRDRRWLGGRGGMEKRGR